MTITLLCRSRVAGCDRACLIGDAPIVYLAALASARSVFAAVAANVKFTENGTQAGDRRWALEDSDDAGSAAGCVRGSDQRPGRAVGVLDEGGAPILLSARLKIQDQRIHEIETVAARKGSHALFSPEEFAALPSVYQQVLEPAQRTPRDRMIAIADGYFEGIARHDSKLVSSATDCNRFENGVRMTNRPGAARRRGPARRRSIGSRTSRRCPSGDIRSWTKSEVWC